MVAWGHPGGPGRRDGLNAAVLGLVHGPLYYSTHLCTLHVVILHLQSAFHLQNTDLLLHMMSESGHHLSPFSSMTVAPGWATLGRAGQDRDRGRPGGQVHEVALCLPWSSLSPFFPSSLLT